MGEQQVKNIARPIRVHRILFGERPSASEPGIETPLQSPATTLVAFLLGCSLTFEHVLIEAGVGVRNIERGTLVPMFISSLACRPAGRFHGPMVVTMRPIAEAQVPLVSELTARYPPAHGGPVHVGSPETIGIADLTRPDYGDPVAIHRDDVPVFWACGVTPQAVALEARPELIITHEPGIMFQTDLPRDGDVRS
jgi:uncharacterized protein YcsI (UPF0317 family)